MKAEKVAEGLNSLSYHRPSEDVQAKLELIRQYGKEYFEKVAGLLPDSRDSSLFLTYLEEAQQRAVRSLVVTAPLA